MSEAETKSQAEARARREAIARQPDLSTTQARELDRIMDRDAMGMPESQVKDPNAVNWLVHAGLVQRRGGAFIATDDGARAYVRHLKQGRKV